MDAVASARTHRLGWVVPALLAAAAGLRVSGLELQSLWLDEFLAFTIGQQPLDVLLERSAGLHGQSPLYYIVLRGWTALLGEDSVYVVRSLSACLGMLSLLQLYRFARRFAGVSRARIALGILAFSPLHLYYSQEARMYALLLSLILGCTHLCAIVVREPETRGVRHYAGIAALSLLALYTHYYAVLFLLAIDLWVLLRCFGPDRPTLWRVAGAQALAALLYLPWLPALLAAAGTGGNRFIQYVGLKPIYTGLTFALGYSSVIIDAEAKRDLIGTFLGHAPLLAVGGAAFGWLAFEGVRALRRFDAGLLLLVMLLLGLPLGLATLVSLWFPILSERYLSPALPFFALLLAFGIAGTRGVRRNLPLALAALLVSHSLYNYYFNPRFGNHDWRAVAAYVQERARSGDAVLYHPRVMESCFTFYAGSARPGYGIEHPREVSALTPDRRYWLIVSHPGRYDAQIRAALRDRFALAEDRLFPRGEGIRLQLYEPRAREPSAATESAS